MSSNVCSQCGAPLEGELLNCKYCGTKVQNVQNTQSPVYENGQPVQPQYQQVPNYETYNPGMKKVAVKSKVTAGILGILLGGFGIHKFYLGKVGQGILYILFCWTYIPAIVGFIEGIVYLTKDDVAWAEKVGYRMQSM